MTIPPPPSMETTRELTPRVNDLGRADRVNARHDRHAMRGATFFCSMLASTMILVAGAMLSCGDDASPQTPAATMDAGLNDGTSNDAVGDGGGSTIDGEPADASADAKADTSAPSCNPTSAFGAPIGESLDTGNSFLWSFVLSENGLVATLTSDRDGPPGTRAVFSSTRTAPGQPWSTPTRLNVFDAMTNSEVSVSADGRTMFLDRGVPTSLWIAQRATTASPWNAPTAWSESVAGDRLPALVHDGSAVYFVRANEIYRAARTAPGVYGAPVKVTWTPSDAAPKDPFYPTVTADERTLYLGERPLGGGPFDIFVARRAQATDAWGALQKLDELSSIYGDWPWWISADGCELYFRSGTNFNDAGAAAVVWAVTRGK